MVKVKGLRHGRLFVTACETACWSLEAEAVRSDRSEFQLSELLILELVLLGLISINIRNL